jgi:MFS family permease
MSETQTTLRERLRALPREAWLLFLGTFLNKFGAFVVPFLAIYMTRLGYNSARAGMAVGAYGVGMLIACILGGYLADRFGRRKTIVLSMFSGAGVMLCLSQAGSFPAIVLLACLAGLTAELYRPAASALLTDLVPTGQRVTAFAAYRLAFNAGWAFGPATAGLLARESFFLLFAGNALASVLYGLLAWFALPAGLRSTRAGNTLRETFRVLRDDWRFRQVLCASLGVGLVFVQVFSTMSLEITRSGFGPSVYGLLVSLNGLLVVLCELPLTTLTTRYPARRVMALGYLLIGVGFASNVLPRTLPLLVLTTALFTLGEMVSMPVAGAYVADLAPIQQRGLYMGTYGLVWALAFVAGPSLGMILYSASALSLWVLCGLLGIVAASAITLEPRCRAMSAGLVGTTAQAPQATGK